MAEAAPASWIVPGQMRVVRGFAFGARQPSLAAELRAGQPAARLGELAAGLERLASALGGEPRPQAAGWRACLAMFGHCLDLMLAAAGVPVADRTKVRRAAADADCDRAPSLIAVPVAPGWPGLSLDALRRTLALAEIAAKGADPAALAEDAQAAAAAILASLPHTQTSLLILQGAAGLNVPCYNVAPDCYQFGQGSRSRWFNGTFTDATSAISTRLARDKAAASIRLRQAGLPVMPSRIAADEDSAARIAAGFGYPAVIKPADLDGGAGVVASIESEAELREAYRAARALSPSVMVEKHFDGSDFRMVVLNGELAWTVERVPAGVTGDGASTVAQLVARENADPRRGTGAKALLYPLKLDDDAHTMLARQGLGADAIPAAGRFVRLSRIANVSRGGVPVIANDRVHPDNRALAIAAARALRLDVAGIDLLIPDIARPWHEVGAAICEVNANPQIGGVTAAHLGAQLVASSLQGDGRIPVIAVVGEQSDGGFVRELGERLAAAGWRAGLHDAQGIAIAGETVMRGSLPALAAGELILTNPGVDVAVLSFGDSDPLENGLASDRIDWLVLAGSHVGASPGGGAALSRIVSALVPACTGTLAVLADAGIAVPQVANPASGMTILPEPLAREDAIARIVADAVHMLGDPPDA